MLAILSFIKINIKWVAIIILVLAGLFLFWKFNNMASKLATAEHVISQLEENVRDKERALKFEQDLRSITEDSLERIQEDNRKLSEQLENIGTDLGEDSSDLAPASIREQLRRLRDLP